MTNSITQKQAQKALDMCADIIVETFGHDYDGMPYAEATNQIAKIAREMFMTMCAAKGVNKVKKN